MRALLEEGHHAPLLHAGEDGLGVDLLGLGQGGVRIRVDVGPRLGHVERFPLVTDGVQDPAQLPGRHLGAEAAGPARPQQADHGQGEAREHQALEGQDAPVEEVAAGDPDDFGVGPSSNFDQAPAGRVNRRGRRLLPWDGRRLGLLETLPGLLVEVRAGA